MRIPGYAPSKTLAHLRLPFRGAASIKVYLQNEPLEFDFKVQDVNRHAGADGFIATAY